MADDKKRDDYAIELGERSNGKPNGHFDAAPRPPPPSAQAVSMASISNNPTISILAYCCSSILMMVANKYVVSGTHFNLNFFLLAVQVRINHVRWRRIDGWDSADKHGFARPSFA